MRIIVTGSRKLGQREMDVDAVWSLRAEMLSVLQWLHKNAEGDPPWRQFMDTIVLVHGACQDRDGNLLGADRIADEIAVGMGIQVERHPADWDAHGPAAGPIRNTAIVKSGADICIAAWNGTVKGSGTFDCMQKCVRARIPVRIVPVGKGEE